MRFEKYIKVYSQTRFQILTKNLKQVEGRIYETT